MGFGVDREATKIRCGEIARNLRLESGEGVYHVDQARHYRRDGFQTEEAQTAFLTCVGQACYKMGWQVYAWCVMSNHYHLAIENAAAKSGGEGEVTYAFWRTTFEFGETVTAHESPNLREANVGQKA
jgi:REP element-mobilizing transposase RayT